MVYAIISHNQEWLYYGEAAAGRTRCCIGFILDDLTNFNYYYDTWCIIFVYLLFLLNYTSDRIVHSSFRVLWGLWDGRFLHIFIFTPSSWYFHGFKQLLKFIWMRTLFANYKYFPCFCFIFFIFSFIFANFYQLVILIILQFWHWCKNFHGILCFLQICTEMLHIYQQDFCFLWLIKLKCICPGSPVVFVRTPVSSSILCLLLCKFLSRCYHFPLSSFPG